MQADANFNPNRQIYQARAGGKVRPVLSVDLDNVLRDQIGSIIEAVWQRYGRRLTREMFSCWDPPMGGLVGISDEEFTAWAWSDPAIFVEASAGDGRGAGPAGAAAALPDRDHDGDSAPTFIGAVAALVENPL